MTLNTKRSQAIYIVSIFLILFITQVTAQSGNFNPVTREILVNPSPDDWLMLGRTYDEQRFSPLDQVNQDNVGDLRMVWSRGLPDGSNETIPIVYNGVMYVVSPINSVVALDAITGDLVWEYNRKAPQGVRLSAIAGTSSKSLAIYHDMVYYTSPDGYLVALDARDGSMRWEIESYEPGSGAKNTSAPIVVEGNVITARACRDYANCYIAANDAMTGEEVWRFHTAAGKGDVGGESWGERTDRETCGLALGSTGVI